jgi:hypothetical protein
VLSVTFTVRVNRSSLGPPVKVVVGLDVNNDNRVSTGETQEVSANAEGDHVVTFSASAAATAGLDYVVVVEAPAGSMYSVKAVDGAGKVVASPKAGTVGSSRHGATTGVLS